MDRGDLQQLSKDELIELVPRLQRPDKNSRNSSVPPSHDRKAIRQGSKPGGAKPGHEGHFRKLCAHPDITEDHRPLRCDGCDGLLGPGASGEVIGEYDAIELPKVKPIVTRHRRFCLRCPACGVKTPARLPEAATGTPFGPDIHALAIYPKSFQSVSYLRLEQMLADVFGLSVSQGAPMNMFARAKPLFAAQKDQAVVVLRQATSVASDETGVRIEGLNGFHWVFSCKQAVVHETAFARGAIVVREMMAGHKPGVWLSDRYSAQQNHGWHHQTCLAHLARQVAFGCEAGEDHLPALLKIWFGRVFDLAGRIGDMAGAAIAARRRALEKELDRLLKTATACPVAKALQAKLERAKHQMLTFCRFPGEVEATNNASERHLRPAVIARKVTNGYRAKWSADNEAAMRTTVDTARLKGASPYQTIRTTLG